MQVNLSRGFWRLWLFFSLVWVVFCAWQVIDARAQLKKARELQTYYTKASADAQKLEGSAGVTPIVSAHLAEQVQLNGKIIGQQGLRDNYFFRLLWLVPLVSLVFARGIPWVCEGFNR